MKTLLIKRMLFAMITAAPLGMAVAYLLIKTFGL